MKLKTLGLMMVSTAVLTSANAQEKQSKESHGINTSYMDRSVKPSEDFFRFVNGAWLDKVEIPADRTRWGSFDELRKNTDEDVKAILEEAIKSGKYGPNTDQGKAINYYKTIMDTVTRNKNGIAPLKPYLQKIDAVKNVDDLQKLLAEVQREGSRLGFFGVGVSTDAKDSNRNVVYLGTGSLGLPDREYYVSDTPDNVEKREKYVVHVAKMLQFLGEKEAAAKVNAEKILAFETSLAVPMLDRVERRDNRKTYNPYSIADLEKLAPSIKWGEYLKTVGFTKLDSIIVTQPRYISALEDILKKANVEDWKNYMRWTLLNGSAGVLSTDIETASWEFYSKTLQGALKERPRDEKALQSVNGALGEALGKLYVEKKFPPEAKAKAEAMVRNVFKAFENRINNLPWMTRATKDNAIAKIHKTRVKIGYPDKWKDYSKLVIKGPEDGGTYFENRKNMAKWRFQENLEKLYKPVDKEEWFMSPQTVNAYFNPSYNEIVFPAAILQPPFYDYQADEAVNYGGIGAVIGHEISHSFDDSGSRYDADGNLNNWWTESDLEQFTALGKELSAQYSEVNALPDVKLNGDFTLGENIGDLGGVNAAYDGLQLYLAENGRPENIDGFSPEQRFFMSWATVWRTKYTEDALRNQIKTDTHSPGMYRAVMPLQNVDAFYEAFNISEGDNMYLAPEKRVKIW